MENLSFNSLSWQVSKLIIYKREDSMIKALDYGIGIPLEDITGKDNISVLNLDTAGSIDILEHIFVKETKDTIEMLDSLLADEAEVIPNEPTIFKEIIPVVNIIKEINAPLDFNKYLPKQSSETYQDFTPQQEVAPEDVNFTNPLTDKKLRRTNPKRYDFTSDWYSEAPDSDISNRYDNTIKGEASKLSWQKLPRTQGKAIPGSYLHRLLMLLYQAPNKTLTSRELNDWGVTGYGAPQRALKNGWMEREKITSNTYKYTLTSLGEKALHDIHERAIQLSKEDRGLLKPMGYLGQKFEVIRPIQAQTLDDTVRYAYNDYTIPVGTIVTYIGSFAEFSRYEKHAISISNVRYDIDPRDVRKLKPLDVTTAKLAWYSKTEYDWEELQRVIGPNQIWKAKGAERASKGQIYLHTSNNTAYVGNKLGWPDSFLISNAQWSETENYRPIFAFNIEVSKKDEPFELVQGDKYNRASLDDETSPDWEIENVISYGAFEGYDLVGKILQKVSSQEIDRRVFTYKDFPESVRAFVKDYYSKEIEEFPDLVQHLSSLRVTAAERPFYYDKNVGAEYFDNENLILSYIPLGNLIGKYSTGLVHEIDHVIQYFLKSKGKTASIPDNNDERYYHDNKFYLNDRAEIKARAAEKAFEKLSWKIPQEFYDGEAVAFLYKNPEDNEDYTAIGYINTELSNPPKMKLTNVYFMRKTGYVQRLYNIWVDQSDLYKLKDKDPYDPNIYNTRLSWKTYPKTYTWEEFGQQVRPYQVWELIYDPNDPDFQGADVTEKDYFYTGKNAAIDGRDKRGAWIVTNSMHGTSPQWHNPWPDYGYVGTGFIKCILLEESPNRNTASLKFADLKDKNEQLFNDRYQRYGDDGANLFWSDKASQYARFKLLSKIGDLSKASVLDVGAGFGDFLDFAQEYSVNIGNYVGVDIIPAIIEIAEKKHPDKRFEVRDIIQTPYADNSFDFVIGSGLFALEDEHWSKSVYDMIKAMYDIAIKGVAVNFLKGSTSGGGFRMTTEKEVSDIAKKVTDKIKVTSELSDDITLYMFK